MSDLAAALPVADECESRSPSWIARLSLAESRVWRWALLLLFFVAIGARWGVAEELRSHAIMHLHEWPGSDASQWLIAADRTAGGDWWMERSVPMVTPSMLLSRPPVFWISLWESRLPRGALALYVLAHSRFLTAEPALYQMLSLFAGALAPVLVALTLARLRSREAGLLAGLLVALNSSLLLGSLRIGPWVWDVLFVALLLWTGRRAWDDRRNPAEWAIFGIVSGLAIWMRPLFWWSIPLLLLALLRNRERPRATVIVALLIPLLASTTVMLHRHWRAESPMIPVVGNPAWDFARAWNPEAVRGPVVPPRLELFEASSGSLTALMKLTAQDSRTMALAPTLLWNHLRMVVGARDEAVELDVDYVRRRSLWMQWLTIGPDAAMAMGWGAVLFLLLRKRMPRWLLLLIGIMVTHGFLFTPMGDDRGPLHLLLGIAAALALVDAWSLRRCAPMLLLGFVASWGLLHLLLQLDDRERGSRFRYEDFARSNNMQFRRAMSLDDRQRAVWEMDDWNDREAYERAFDLLGRENLRILQRR